MISFLKKNHWITVINSLLVAFGLFVFFFFLDSSHPYIILISLLFIINSILIFMRSSLRYISLWASFLLNGFFLLAVFYVLGLDFFFPLDPSLMELYEITFLPLMTFLFSFIGLSLLINSITLYKQIQKFRKT